ncbi:uncharacterized protein LOC110711229 [Chenopodium quinoa]|uniref:uncharacterized protein LOC110711229 n=1 Tax=Chenopodium quinoa TaxID=63459 RepID=UPI000B77F0B6|nr:uncharacterized protein LOC110711229 [Chenopodium quinoa]
MPQVQEHRQSVVRIVVQLRASPFAQIILDQAMEKIKMTTCWAAADWFNHLGNGTIDSFQKFTEMFVGRYIIKSVRQRTLGELMAIEQKEDESLRDYIRRFNVEANTIPKLLQEIAVMALVNGLNDLEFKRYLTRKNLSTLAVAFNKAHEYIKSEELMKTSSQVGSANRIILYWREDLQEEEGRRTRPQ